MRQETESEIRYLDLIDDLLGCPGVTPPQGGSGFGRGAVRFQRKIFVMFVRGRLVLKSAEVAVYGGGPRAGLGQLGPRAVILRG
jgi:hypothetical protein